MKKLATLIIAVVAFLSIGLTAKAITANDLGLTNSLIYGLKPAENQSIANLTDGSTSTSYSLGKSATLTYDLESPMYIRYAYISKSASTATVLRLYYDDERLLEISGGTSVFRELDEPLMVNRVIIKNNSSISTQNVNEIAVWGFPPENDNIPPESVNGLKVLAGYEKAMIRWDRSIEPDVIGYNIYVNGVKHNTEPINRQITNYTADGLTDGEPHSIQISAVDFYGNESDLSDPVTVTPGVNVNLAYGIPFLSSGGEEIYEWTDGNYTTSRSLAYKSTARMTFDRPVSTTGFKISYSKQTGHITVRMIGSDGQILYERSPAYTNNEYSVYLENIMRLEVDLINDISGYSANIYEFELYGQYSPPDDEPPGVPQGLVVAPGDGQATASWTANSELDLKGYNLYLDNVKHNADLIEGTSYTIDGLTNWQTYNVQITAVDIWGNESALSTPVTVIPLAPDDDPPGVPQGLVVVPGDGQATASWTANSEIDMHGYNLYLDGVKHNADLIEGTSYTVHDLTPGQTYTVQITAVDIWGNESDLSVPVSVEIQSLVPSPRYAKGRVHEETQNIVLEWTDGDPRVIGFNVYRKQDKPKIMMMMFAVNTEDYVKINDEPITSTTYAIPFDDRGKVYEFAITSVDAQGQESDPAYVSVQVPTTPLVIDPNHGWGMTAGDIVTNAIVIVGSLAAFVLLAIAIANVPRLIDLIKNAVG